MKSILKKKKVIIGLVAGLLLAMIILVCVIQLVKSNAIKEATPLYEKSHALYFKLDGLQYATDEENNRVYIERDDKKYYQMKNYDELFLNRFSSSMLKKVHQYLNVLEEDNQYYIQDIGRGLSGYYGTTLKIKKYSKNKITFIAQSKFCEIDYRVSYGDGCQENHYYTIDKPFTIVKEKDTWKVSEYTSVFEFKDSEIK